MDTNLSLRVFIQLHSLLASMKQYNAIGRVAWKKETEAML